MAMLKLWLTDNSFKYVQLNDVVSFNVVRKESEMFISSSLLIEIKNIFFEEV